MQHGLSLYDLPVSPLAVGERLFNSKTKDHNGETMKNGMGNEESPLSINPE